MNGRWLIAVLMAAVLGAGLVGAGFWVGRATATQSVQYADWPKMPRWGMMEGPGMMGRGMMGGFGVRGTTPGRPLSIDEAREAVEAYIKRFGDENLEAGEIMIFDNHAYAEIMKRDTGTGATEVLVDPVTRAVFLEFGPAMMWNTEYGMMGGRGHGMMAPGRRWFAPQPGEKAEPTITEENALEIAQDFVNASMPGISVGDEADVFPGYYTLHTFKDGKVYGMMSVNAYTGQVWVHTWHGTFIEMSEESD